MLLHDMHVQDPSRIHTFSSDDDDDDTCSFDANGRVTTGGHIAQGMRRSTHVEMAVLVANAVQQNISTIAFCKVSARNVCDNVFIMCGMLMSDMA